MTVGSRAFAAFIKSPPALTHDVQVLRDQHVRAPDGIDLLTDVYLTGAAGPQPAVLIRTPYGRRGVHGGMARQFAERGYHVVCQSCRGTFGSGGAIDFDREAADGRATADWMAGQPWCDGQIGGFGASYLSFTQWALASTRPPQLKAMAIAVFGAERRNYYPGGSFSLDRALTWTYLINSQERSRLAILGARRALRPAFDHLPLAGADEVAVGHAVPYYRDWLEHSSPGDPYWAATDFRPLLRDLGIPVAMTAGWHDIFLPHMIEDYLALREGGQDVRLRVGGWTHSSMAITAHSLRDALALFDTCLRRRPADPVPAARIEVMGGGGWRDLGQWPPPAAVQRWSPQPGGALSTATPPACEPDRYQYDPADPTPSVGGPNLHANSGPKDNRALESRPDVLVYTSDPLAADLEVIGPVSAELHVSSTLEHTDFFARLCDVDPRGRSVNVTDGLLRLEPGRHPAAPDGTRAIRVELWPTAHRFQAGHRIRLQISSGAHPRYARNLGSGEPLATATTLRVANQALYHDPDHPSAVLLPVASPPPPTVQDAGAAG